MTARLSDSEISRILEVLSEPTRIRIIRLISGSGELRSCDLLPEFEITQPTLSHHLNLLVENDVLTSRKAGRCIYFSVNKGTVSLVAQLMESIASGKASSPAQVKTAAAKAAEPVKEDDASSKDKSEKVRKVKKDKKKKKKDKKEKKDKKDKKKKK